MAYTRIGPRFAGAATIYGFGPRASPSVKLAREAMRANPRLGAVDALLLATDVVNAAAAHGLPAGFLGATLLQESAFDPTAMSSAGAVGIAQFTLPTAAAVGIDPWNPHQAMPARHVCWERTRPRTATSPMDRTCWRGGINAGPGAVTAYHGVPRTPRRVSISTTCSTAGRASSDASSRAARSVTRRRA